MLDLTGETGSYRFMAPEVFQHKPYGRPVDVYSFAMIAYNLLESRAPWAELSGEKAAKRGRDGDRPEIPRATDSRISAILTGCWQHAPPMRPSFAAVLDLFEKFPTDKIEGPQRGVPTASQPCACAVS